MKRLVLLASAMVLTITGMLRAETFEFSAGSGLAYIGQTEVLLPELIMDDGMSMDDVTYEVQSNSPFEVTASGEVVLSGDIGKGTITAVYTDHNNAGASLKTGYELSVIDPQFGEYRKVKSKADLTTGEDDSYVLVNTDYFKNKKLCYLQYSSDGRTLIGATPDIISEYWNTEESFYSKIITGSAYRFQLNAETSTNTSEDVYSLKCQDTTSDKYLCYPTKQTSANLTLSDTPKKMTIGFDDFEQNGITIKFEDKLDKTMGVSGSNFQIRSNRTPGFALFRYYPYEKPQHGAVIAKVNGNVAEENYEVAEESSTLTLEVPDGEGIIVYYQWLPSESTESESKIVKVESEDNKYVRYTGPVELTSEGTLTYYGERYGLGSDDKIQLIITKASTTPPTPTSVNGIEVKEDSKAKYYTLDGQKLAEKPSKAGVYVILEEGKSKTLIIK